jgi:RNA polymerase sigma factor (sigma-70 family)
MLTGQFRLNGSYPLDERQAAFSDEELLERFLNRDSETAEAAFQALVVRHGPMVLGVCRHILNQLQDAEDAFQATFLVLARKAGSIRDRRVLARWLYEVAYRIAIRARTNGVRRRTHERQGGEMSSTVSIDNHGWIELRPVLHEEVNRLPDKYRVPVILCYLEGKTNEEAAALLQWPVGTVKGRLSRARDLLRSRLARRGLALSAALLVTALSDGTVIAEVVPTRLVDKTVTSAMVLTDRKVADPGVITASVGRMMSFAVTPPWASKAALVAVLLLVITSALATLAYGLYPDLRYSSDFRVNFHSFLPAAFGKSSGTPAGSGCCASASASGSTCAGATPAAGSDPGPTNP